MLLFLALTTGDVGRAEKASAGAVIIRAEAADGLSLPQAGVPVRIGAVAVETPRQAWTVNAMWWKTAISVRFSRSGSIEEWEAEVDR
jgi:hypothetical protein